MESTVPVRSSFQPSPPPQYPKQLNFISFLLPERKLRVNLCLFLLFLHKELRQSRIYPSTSTIFYEILRLLKLSPRNAYLIGNFLRITNLCVTSMVKVEFIGRLDTFVFSRRFMTPQARKNRSPVSVCLSVCLYAICVYFY